ncbi:MAG: hypothetical protein H7145_05325 [Akkermansiaceae bacterium]|nr:hypothetical protein [Armatimonadota bacterium]
MSGETDVVACCECGAPLPLNGECYDRFNDLLLLEWAIPEGAGLFAHFYAVASYGLQHPDRFGYSMESLRNLRENLVLALAGNTSIEEIRLRTRRVTSGSNRITWQQGEPSVVWHRGDWPFTIMDVLNVAPEAEAYEAHVEAWARSVCDTLSMHGF